MATPYQKKKKMLSLSEQIAGLTQVFANLLDDYEVPIPDALPSASLTYPIFRLTLL